MYKASISNCVFACCSFVPNVESSVIELYILLYRIISFVGSKFDGIDYLKVKDYIALGRTPYTNALGRLDETDLKVVNETIELLQLDHGLPKNYSVVNVERNTIGDETWFIEKVKK